MILPLIVRDVYGGDSAQLSLVSLGFWGGTIGSMLVQLRLGALRRPGRAIVLALFLGAGVLAAMAWPSPFPAFVALCLVWGLGAGVVMTRRSIPARACYWCWPGCCCAPASGSRARRDEAGSAHLVEVEVDGELRLGAE